MDIQTTSSGMIDVKSMYYDTVLETLPFLTYEEKQRLGEIVNERYSPCSVDIYNSHTCETNRVTADDLMGKIFNDKLIMVENGIMFRDVKSLKELPPSVEVEEWYGYERKKKKDLMKYYDDVTKGNDPVRMLYNKYGQEDCKRKMNTFYGLMAQTVSPLFNHDLASSITMRGRSVISVCGLIVESVLSGFFNNSLESLLHFIKMGATETEHAEIFNNMECCPEDVLYNMGIVIGDYRYGVLRETLGKLTTIQINRLYMKNNFACWMKAPGVSDTIADILRMIDKTNKPFINPVHPPKELSELLEKLRGYLGLLYGFYWYQADVDEDFNLKINTQEKINSIWRKNIVLIDTDSNMISLGTTSRQLIEFFEDVIPKNMTERENKFNIANIATFIVDHSIRYGLELYKEAVHIPDRYKFRINMKTEFYYSTFALTSRKKNYAAICDIKEGVIYPTGKLDIKGLMLTKSSVNANIGGMVKNIINHDILRKKKIDIQNVVSKLRKAERDVKDIMRGDEGSSLFLSEKINEKLYNVLPMLARTKSAELYNVLKLGDAIVAPARFLTVDINYKKEDIADNYSDELKKIEIYQFTSGIHKALMKYTDLNLVDIYKKYSKIFPKIDIDELVKMFENNWERFIELVDDQRLLLFVNRYKVNENVKRLVPITDNTVRLTRDEIVFKLIEQHDDDLDLTLQYLQELAHKINLANTTLNTTFVDNILTTSTVLKLDSYPREDVIKKFKGHYKKLDLPELTKLSFPESILESIPDFIRDILNDIPNSSQIQNLAAPVVECLRLSILRNGSGKQSITNILSYF